MAIAEFIVALGLVAWGLSFFLLAMDFPPSLNPHDFGPGLLPKIISFIQMALGAGWIWQVIRRPNKAAKFPMKYPGNILAIMLLILVYAWSLPRMGYYFSTAFFLPIMLMLAMERQWLRIAGITIGFIFFAWGAFDLLLKVPLPK